MDDGGNVCESGLDVCERVVCLRVRAMFEECFELTKNLWRDIGKQNSVGYWVCVGHVTSATGLQLYNSFLHLQKQFCNQLPHPPLLEAPSGRCLWRERQSSPSTHFSRR